jgi:predicted RNA methylase
MVGHHQESAETTRRLIQQGLLGPAAFRVALLSVPPAARDEWLDGVLGLGDLPEDGPELPRGCVPYLPCAVEVLLRMVDEAPIRGSDVFVDVGAGLGRPAMLVHLLTGAGAIGIEVQPALVRAARDAAARLSLSRVSFVDGDATRLAASMPTGSVFFFYCPFGGARLAKALADLEALARTRTLRICSFALPPLAGPWLTLEVQHPDGLAIYRSTLHDATFGTAVHQGPEASAR